MRLFLIVVASFALAISAPTPAFSQEDDFSLIDDANAAQSKKAKSSPKAAAEGSPNRSDAEAKPKQENSFDQLFGAVDAAARKGRKSSKPQLPETLAEALAEALEANPDVLLAEAKLRQSQAEYSQAKLKVAQDVTLAFYERSKRQMTLHTHREAGKKVPGSTPESEIQRMSDEVAESEAKLAYLLGAGVEGNQAERTARTRLRGFYYTLGGEKKDVTANQPARDPAVDDKNAAKETPRETTQPVRITGVVKEFRDLPESRPGRSSSEKRPEIPEKYRKVLQKPVQVKFQALPLDQVIDQLNRITGEELPILQQAAGSRTAPITVELAKEVPLQTALELLADLTGCAFVFRDYGLLVLPQAATASQYPRSATIPEQPFSAPNN